MANVLTPNAKQQFFDNNGRPANGYKLFTYVAGSSTKRATYGDSTLSTVNTNPIILDYRGEANVWLVPNLGYKFIFAPANDTDPPTNPIWSVDNISSAQLLTLYGGVDTGSANNYVLTFVAPYTSYIDGTVIYWVPSNTNTGASTLNVNGLGALALINQNGSALTAGQLVVNQVAVVMLKSGQWLLISSGLASTASQTLFVARRSTGVGNQVITNNATTTAIFDTEDVDQGSNYNNATGIYTAPSAGVYAFACSLRLFSNASAGQLASSPYFSKNNNFGSPGYFRLTGQFKGDVSGVGIPASQPGLFVGTAAIQMNAGDTMRINIQQPNNGGGNFAIQVLDGDNNFYGYKLA